MAGLLKAAALLLVLGTTFVSAQDPQCYNLKDLLGNLGLNSFKKLLEIMVNQDKNFQDILDEARPMTIFAPTDAAISHRGWQLGLKTLGDDVGNANTTLIWPIMQYHIIQGAGVDFVNYPSTLSTFFYTDLGMSPCLPAGTMPVGLTVDKITSKALGADKTADLLVNAVQQKSPVLYQISTCNGITKVYVIDDLLTPCCTNLFDLRLSPALGPIFDDKKTLPMAKRFFQNVAAKVFVATATKPEDMWKLPKTMFIPKEEALNTFLNDTVGEKPDGRKAVKLYAALAAYHLSNASATKQEVLTASNLPIPTWSTGKEKCSSEVTLVTYADENGIPKLRAQGGNNTAEVEAVFDLCGNSTLYVIDKPLLPCNWEEIIPCTVYSDVQEDPRVQALINDTKDEAKVAFTSIFSGYLTDQGASKEWQIPNTLFIPDGAEISKLVTPYLKYDENDDGKSDIFNKYSLGLMNALTEYHMSQDVVDQKALASGKSVTISMDLAKNATEKCQQTITISPTAAPAAANGKPTAPALKVTAGNSTATVLRAYPLGCVDTVVYVLDSVLMPCKLQELLPCTEFFEVQRYPELEKVTKSEDPLVKSFMGQFAGAVTEGEGADAKWVLPKTVFFPTEAAIKAALPEWIGDNDLDAYRAQLIFQVVAFYHLSDSASGPKLLKSSLSRSLNLTTWLSGNSSRSCQQSATLTYAVDPKTNKQTDQLVVVAGNSTAKVVNQFETCGGSNVYLVDSLLMPCNIEEFLPCQQYFDVIKEDLFLPFYNTTEKYMVAFRNWMSGHLYKKGQWNLPGTLFVPNGDAVANSLQPWLKTNIGKKLFTESRKKVWETMTTYYMGVESVDAKTFMQEASTNPDVSFNMTTRLAQALGAKAPCSQNLILSVSNDTGSPAIKVQAGNSTANVIATYSLCGNKNVYVIDNPLYPCMMSATFQKASGAGMLSQGFSALVAAVVASLMVLLH